MKILVLSDSHSSHRFMRECIESVKPDAVIHLGDFVRDGEAMKEALSGYLKVLEEQNAEFIGGSVPEDGFYYIAK